MAADYSRIHRLLKIFTLIQGAKGWTPRRLAAECNTTERTIFRDMKMLEAAGIPYLFDPQDKCYTIRRDFFLPPVQLTFDEALAITALAEHVGGREQIPFTQPAVKAICKIRGQLPRQVRDELEKMENYIAIQLAAAMPPESAADVYQSVRHAIAAGRALRCEYESVSNPEDNDKIFLFKPYALFFNQRAWYTVGYHDLYDSIRCMKLNRFTRIEATDYTYKVPADFSLQKYLGNSWRMIRGDKRYEVELAFDARFAETIADTHWHATQEVIWNDDGSILFRCAVDGLDEIVWWILGMGPHCTVLKPAELARRVAQLAEQTAANYAGGNGRPRRRTTRKARV